MTSNMAPDGLVTSSNASADAYKLFDRQSGRVTLSQGDTGWAQFQFDSPEVIDAYLLQAPDDNSSDDDMPWQWNLEASNDGANWSILDTQDAQDTWASSEWRQYAFHNDTAYSHYRLSFSQGGGTDGANSAIGQIVFHRAGASQTPFALTASSVDGINGGQGFQTADVGRHIRFRGSDGFWRWFKIRSYTSPTVVQVQLYGQSLLDLKAQTLWRLGAWSDTTGWPRAIGWHNNRLAFAGTDEEPQKICKARQVTSTTSRFHMCCRRQTR